MNIPGHWCKTVNINNHEIDRINNTIDGQKLEFGNSIQLNILKDIKQILAGDQNISELELSFRSYNYLSNRYYHVSRKKADSIVTHFQCICCGRYNKLVFHYDPHLHYESILHTRDFDHECWNCDTEYHIDKEGLVFLTKAEDAR